jgi:hypothetical protein
MTTAEPAVPFTPARNPPQGRHGVFTKTVPTIGQLPVEAEVSHPMTIRNPRDLTLKTVRKQRKAARMMTAKTITAPTHSRRLTVDPGPVILFQQDQNEVIQLQQVMPKMMTIQAEQTALMTNILRKCPPLCLTTRGATISALKDNNHLPCRFTTNKPKAVL